MKKILLTALIVPAMALAQTYPSPTFNSLTLQNPLSPANGGTGSTASTGTGSAVLSNSPTLVTPALGTPSSVTLTNGTGLPVSTGISGLGTGVATALSTAVSGSGGMVLGASPTIASPTVTGAFTATGLVTPADHAAQAANTILANGSASTASPTAIGVPGCSSATNALQWTSGTGFACNSSINAATLGGATFANPGPIGATPSGASFTTLSASSTVSGAGITALFNNTALTGTPTAPTTAVGTNTTQIATMAAVAAHAPCASVLDHGGDNTGTNDNTSALAATLASGPSGRACAFFGPGKWKFTSQNTYTIPTNTGSVTIEGSGADVTELTFPNTSGGIVLNLPTPANSFHLRNFTATTGQAGTTDALQVNQQTTTVSGPANTPQSDITNVTFRGADGYAITDYWSYSAILNSVSTVNYTNVFITGPAPGGSGYTSAGIGIQLNGTSAANGVVHNFYGCTFNYIGVGLGLETTTQGISVQQSNFTGGNYGILTSGSGAGDQLYIAGSQFNDNVGGIVTPSPYTNTMVIGNLFIVPANKVGIWLQSYNSFTVLGNTFNSVGGATTQVGVLIDQINGGIGGIVTGNTFNNLFYAIQLTANSARANVQSNSYIGNGTNVQNSGTGTGNLANVVGGGSP